MTIVAILSLVLGAFLGVRYRVFALLPVTSVALCFVVVDGILRGDEFWLVVLRVLVATTILQFGYVCGAVARTFFASRRSSDMSRPLARAAGDVGGIT